MLSCLERDHWNYVASMDEDKASQILSERPIEFAKYPYSANLFALCIEMYV